MDQGQFLQHLQNMQGRDRFVKNPLFAGSTLLTGAREGRKRPNQNGRPNVGLF